MSDNLSAPHRRARRAGPRDWKATHEPQELSSEARVTGGGHRPVGAPRRVPDEPLQDRARVDDGGANGGVASTPAAPRAAADGVAVTR